MSLRDNVPEFFLEVASMAMVSKPNNDHVVDKLYSDLKERQSI